MLLGQAERGRLKRLLGGGRPALARRRFRRAGKPHPLCYDRVPVEDSSGSLVDLVIVNYRSYDELSRCLTSLEHARARFGLVVVIDHESDLEAAARVSAAFPWVRVIERATNEGFATGVNHGVRSTSAPFILLLNPDCVVHEGGLSALLEYAYARSDAAIVGPGILNADGTRQASARRFPNLTTMIAGRSSWLTRRFPRNPLSRWNLPGTAHGSEPIEVDWVSGACMVMRRDAYEQVGGMDERFFLYWEDADLCRRLSQRGWRIVYFPAAAVVHVGGRSSIHAYRESLAAFHQSAFALFRKHAGWGWLLLSPVVYAALQLRLRVLLFVHRDVLTSTRASRPARSAPVAFRSGPEPAPPGVAAWPSLGARETPAIGRVTRKDTLGD